MDKARAVRLLRYIDELMDFADASHISKFEEVFVAIKHAQELILTRYKSFLSEDTRALRKLSITISIALLLLCTLDPTKINVFRIEFTPQKAHLIALCVGAIAVFFLYILSRLFDKTEMETKVGFYTGTKHLVDRKILDIEDYSKKNEKRLHLFNYYLAEIQILDCKALNMKQYAKGHTPTKFKPESQDKPSLV